MNKELLEDFRQRLGDAWGCLVSLSKLLPPIRPSKPQDAEQQQSQPQGSMWTLSGQESRMWDAKHVSNLRGVSLNLGPACKSTFPIPESWEKLLSLRGALLPSSGALENGIVFSTNKK